MIKYPNCKINLGLHVVERRPDGYHNLETLFLTVPLCDELEIVPAEAFGFEQEGIAVEGAVENNLCMKALRLLQKDYPQVANVQMRLRKQIPFGAGLGGGSADAAFVLVMLNELFSLQLSTETLRGYASRLGADCAFFVENRAAYATGIGDQLQPCDVSVLRGYRLLLWKPDEAVSTVEAYRGIVPRNQRTDALATPDLREVLQQPIETWRESMLNDFEETVFRNHPCLAELKEAMYAGGARYAAMSGSGATVFGLFDADTPLPQPPQDELFCFQTLL